MERVRGEAYARAGLLGNPSDQYEGKAIALALANFRARVELVRADRFEIVPGADDVAVWPSVREAFAALDAYGCEDGVRLLRAALRQALARRGGLDDLAPDDARLRFRMSYATDIPRQVGLAGSSAIITAALRALFAWFGVAVAPAELAELALACETEELGITAGPMDRVIQAHQGVLHMDFAPPRRPESYRALDARLLPPLFVAWDPRGGAPSRKVHSDVRARWLRGDADVRRAIAVFPELVDAGIACLESRDLRGFRALVDRNFDTRASIFRLSPVDYELVRVGRAHGAAVKLCGSGGAVIGVLADEAERAGIEAAYRSAGFGVLQPEIAPAVAGARA